MVSTQEGAEAEAKGVGDEHEKRDKESYAVAFEEGKLDQYGLNWWNAESAKDLLNNKRGLRCCRDPKPCRECCQEDGWWEIDPPPPPPSGPGSGPTTGGDPDDPTGGFTIVFKRIQPRDTR
jgi:hypothetical protein